VKIAVRVSDLSWDTLCTTYSTWERIAKSYPTWQAVKEGNAAQTSWQTIYAQTDWEAVRQGYYDWFNVKDNVK
jgi:hypothetical protein